MEGTKQTKRPYKYLSHLAQITFRAPVENAIMEALPTTKKLPSIAMLLEHISGKTNPYEDGDVLADIYEDDSIYKVHFVYSIYKTANIEYAVNYTPRVREKNRPDDLDLITIFHVFVDSIKEFYSEYDMMLRIKKAFEKTYLKTEGYIITSGYH